MNRFFRIVLILFCLCPSLARSQAHVSSLLHSSGLHSSEQNGKKHGLKGQVKLMTQVQSPITNRKTDWLDGHSGQNYTEEYNEQGFLQKRISRDDHNEPQSATHYEYNSKGQISAFWEESLAAQPLLGRTEGRIDYEFNAVKKAYIVRDKRIIMGRPQNSRTETTLDSLNRVLIKREYRQDTLLVREERQKWDVQGYITERATRSSRKLDDDFSLDTAGFTNFLQNELNMQLTELEKKALKKSVDSQRRTQDSLQKIQPEWSGDTTRYRNEYDTKKRLIRQEAYWRKQITHIVSFTYTPEAKRVVSQLYNRNGDMTSETISLQDPVDDHILSDSSRHKNGDKWEVSTFNYENYPKPVYLYQYDSHGNWIEQKQVDAAGKQISVTLVRIIEYY